MPKLPTPNPNDELIIRAIPRYEGKGDANCITDFMGIKTRLEYFSGLYTQGGVVEEYPFPANFHATAIEWAGVLRSVNEATDEFVAIELGAGWGPWLITGATAARRKGIKRIQLVGVEGSGKHVAFMRQHFLDNGFNPDEHQILHGVVGTYNGIAKFPKIAATDPVWGAAAVYKGTQTSGPAPIRMSWKARLKRLVKRTRHVWNGENYERVPCHALASLVEPHSVVDLIHVDIQGAECDVISSARKVLESKARRLVVGTHGRLIEERLMNELCTRGWELESEEPCQFDQHAAGMALSLDGCQVWRNKRFDTRQVARDQRRAA